MLQGGIEWYLALQPVLQGALISAGASLVLGLFGFLSIWFTAFANRRHALKASRDQQKLEIYKAILADIDAATEAQIDVSAYVTGATMGLRIQADMLPINPNWPPVTQRVQKFEALHYAQSAALSKLHRFIEQWAIIDPRLHAFGMAFGYQHHQVSEAARAMSDAFRSTLPTDIPDQPGAIFPYTPPQKRHLDQVSTAADRYNHESGLVGSYISDFNIELQPLLLGHLFGRNIVRRDPPDPSQFAIRLDRHRQIIRHFKTTPFFSNGDRMMNEIRAQHREERKPLWRKKLDNFLRATFGK